MSVEIKEVVTPADRKAFVNLESDIYKGNKYWVPHIKSDEVKALIPEFNPAFEFCKAKFWLAYKNGKCVGRIGGIINELYNEKTGEKLGRFTRPEFVDDPEVSSKLFETVETWVKEQGMSGIHGPLGFSNLDHQALLIEGFDHLPSIASVYHLPHYKRHIEKLGYEKQVDWIEFRLTLGDSIPEKAMKLNQMVKKRYGLNVVTFRKQEELKPYANKVFDVLNDAFKDLFAVAPLNEKMIKYYTTRYFNMLNPKFVKVITDKDENVVGFIVGLPSLSEAMQKAKGKLFPFGFWYIMKALKRPKVVDLLLTGIKPEFQGMGAPALLITELQKTLIEHGVKYVETTGMIETNQKAIQHWKNYEHIQHKRKRCFIKQF